MNKEWYRQIGERSDMVISTRIRLARNLSHYPFPNRMNEQQRAEVVEAVCEAVEQIGGLVLHRLELKHCPQRDILALVDRHVISYEFAQLSDATLLLSEDERISIMINEEDHVRIQVMSAGLDLKNAYELADRVDTALDERLHFAFDDRLGYLTQCPTNLGTGMRASLMLHLPALQEGGAIRHIAGSVAKLGLTIRGAFGEGSQPQGAFYQMSNQVTLGISESAAIDNLIGIAEQIMKEESVLRAQLSTKPAFEDRVWRSFGLLNTARLLSNDEAVNLLSNVRLGICVGILENIPLETVTALISDVRPGCLMSKAGSELSRDERDKTRADLVRKQLSVS